MADTDSDYQPQEEPMPDYEDETGDPSRRGPFFPGHTGPRDGDDPSGDGQGSIAETLSSLAATLDEESPSVAESGHSAYPRQPRTQAESGLSKAFLSDMVLKVIHYAGSPSAGQLMRRLGLGQALVQQILTGLQEERLCEVLSQSDLYTGNYRYRLSERGTARVVEALERTRYAGPVPVTAEQYTEVIRKQQARRAQPSRQHIASILEDLILAPRTAEAVARALYSGKATMFYGPSGSGKTSILDRFASNPSGTVLVPHAIYAYGQVIRVFDPSIHHPVEEFDERNSTKDDGKLDARWVLVRRPAVVLGSEIGPEVLDLAYDPQSRFYQAPPHIKAQGGVLVVDDLGRQRSDCRELLTRWLISAERGWGILSVITGEKLTVPFDVQLLFGTHRSVHELGDDALLRRILYKVEIPSPGPGEFAEILRRLCRDRGVGTPEGAIERVVERLFEEADAAPRAAHARDLVQVIVEGAAFEDREPVLDDASFEEAFRLMTQRPAADKA